MSRELTGNSYPMNFVHVVPVKPVTVLFKVYIRTRGGIPAQNVVENEAAQGLLSLARLDEVGHVGWDASSVVIPDRASLEELIEQIHQIGFRVDELWAEIYHDLRHNVHCKELKDRIFVLRESLKELLGLEEA